MGSSPQVPTSAGSIKVESSLTSSTSGGQKFSYYSGTGCANLMGYHQYNIKNIKLGSVVANLSTGSSRPSSAYQVSYEYKDIITKSVTSDTQTLALLDRISGSGIAHKSKWSKSRLILVDVLISGQSRL